MMTQADKDKLAKFAGAWLLNDDDGRKWRFPNGVEAFVKEPLANWLDPNHYFIWEPDKNPANGDLVLRALIENKLDNMYGVMMKVLVVMRDKNCYLWPAVCQAALGTRKDGD